MQIMQLSLIKCQYDEVISRAPSSLRKGRKNGSVVEGDKELETVRALEYEEILPSLGSWPGPNTS